VGRFTPELPGQYEASFLFDLPPPGNGHGPFRNGPLVLG
jgi:hypothetical protein